MSDETKITILGDQIPYSNELIAVDKLKYLVSNPRVHSSIYGSKVPDDHEELQGLIETQMLEEASVKNLIPDIRKQGGLVEAIFVRIDTMEVVEGNSRLAAYRYLHNTDKVDSDKWEYIPCQVVSSLSNKQQYAFLNQIHVKGKTPWLAYEKANHAYIIKKTEKISDEEIAETLSITPTEVYKRIRTIKLMEDNDDRDRSHFSYYEVLTRTRKIAEELQVNPHLEKVLLSKIKSQKDEDTTEGSFKALELRDKLKVVLNKKRILKRFMEDKLTLDGAYQNARLSGPHQNINSALEKIQNIEKNEIMALSGEELNKLGISLKNLVKSTERINSMVAEAKGKIAEAKELGAG